MFGFGRELSFVGKTSPCPHDRHSTWVSCSQPAEIARISSATTAVIAIRSRCERVSVAITTIFPRPVEHIDRYQVQEVGTVVAFLIATFKPILRITIQPDRVGVIRMMVLLRHLLDSRYIDPDSIRRRAEILATRHGPFQLRSDL